MNARQTDSERAHIVVLMANLENRRLLSETLADRYRVSTELDPFVRADGDGPFDLCILDGSSVQKFHGLLSRIRRSFDPIYLPILMLADRQRVDLRDSRLWELVDDIVFRPVERLELATRVQSMLRTRALSLRAQRLTTLYEHERLVAQRLQDAALPNLKETVSGLKLDAVYRPADDATRVGGDWFDALRLADGRIVITIGDVSGSGLDAAVTMSQMRHVLRAIANVHSDPALMLDAAERTLTGADLYRQLTCFVGVFDLVSEEITYATAGHPPPLMRYGTTVEALPCDGLMLGTSIRLPRETNTVALPRQSLVVLYTDGVTEAERDPVVGEQKLRTAIASLSENDPHPATSLADAMRVSSARDDVALLTVYYSGLSDATLRRWSFDARDATLARAMIDDFAEILKARKVSLSALTAAETIFAELLGNVVRYAPGIVHVVVDTGGPSIVLNVLDRGEGFSYFPKLPQDLLSERGRGLFIVSKLAGEFTVHRRRDGGSHARVVLD